jgi:hypothetical protein
LTEPSTVNRQLSTKRDFHAATLFLQGNAVL